MQGTETMKNTATLFFGTGALCALIGMVWGIMMAASNDHGMAPAHAHLNLIGFVVMSIYGTFYALAPRAAATRLALAHFLLTVAAVAVMVPGIAIALSNGGETLAKAGSVMAVLSMAIFAYTVFTHGVGAREPEAQEAPAE